MEQTKLQQPFHLVAPLTFVFSEAARKLFFSIIIIGCLNLQSKLSMGRTVFDFQKNKLGLLVNK